MLNDPVLWDSMNKLFTVIMILDRDLKVVSSSATLQRYMPKVVETPLLPDLFEIKRPARVLTFEDMRKSADSLYLMTARDGSFAVRGQILDLGMQEGEFLSFLGSPWLSWLHTHCTELDIGLNDFPAQDAQMDQLFYISTEKRMVEDLEQLNQELKAATEKLQAAQAVKNAFFAQISHEMRTPLNGVVSALTLLGDQGLTGQAATLLDLAGESSRNLMQVINYVLDVSKLELSQPASGELPFDLPDLIASVIGIVRARAIEKGLGLQSHIDGRLSSVYLGDSALLRQSLLNLVNNAIKFTDYGEIHVRVTPALDDGMTLRIEVSDTGIGIAAQDQARIFEPFQRVREEGSVDRGASTGLGLDIARRNISYMGGSLGVTSTPGEGSTFWLELPCLDASSKDGNAEVRAAEARENRSISGRILLVDDNDTNLMLGQMILESMGAQVLCASSGEAAILAVRDENPDLVLMDISMPGIDGFEATARIREFRDTGSLPIVALTAYASSTEREMSQACGMNGYLTKPIVREELAEMLSKYLPEGKEKPPLDAASSQVRTPSAVDHSVLEELAKEIGNANLTKVIDKFLDEIDHRWALLASATTNAELAREAHTLASTCRSFGLPSIGEKIACIERHARFGDTAGEPPCIGATGSELLQGASDLRAAIVRYRVPG